jgi:hypothetical protein
MDPVANKIEQIRVAKAITAVWDDCNADGTLTYSQMEEIADLANRLAELVAALAEWERWKTLTPTLVR